MRKLAKSLLFGAVIGGGTAGVLTAPSWLPAATASETVVAQVAAVVPSLPASTYDPDSLVKFEGHEYAVSYDESVVQEPIRQMRIKKIEYGRVSFVDIAVTPTGTYSNEALFSPHIRYPGITVEQVDRPLSHVGVYQWSGKGWTALRLSSAGSFSYVYGNRSYSSVHN